MLNVMVQETVEMNPDSLEARKSERYFCGIPVSEEMMVVNLSRDGFLLSANRPWGIHDKVILFEVPILSISLTLRGKVKWCRPSPKDPHRWLSGVAFDSAPHRALLMFVRVLAKSEKLLAQLR